MTVQNNDKDKEERHEEVLFCSAKDLNHKSKKLLSRNLDMIERSNWDLTSKMNLGYLVYDNTQV